MVGKVNRYVHRLAWEIRYGEIPDGIDVLHSCDVKNCINPLHLFLGDDQSNASDKAKKWRGNRSKLGMPFGVYQNKKCKNGRPFRAYVVYHKKQYYLGSYATAEEANLVAVTFKNALYGET